MDIKLNIVLYNELNVGSIKNCDKKCQCELHEDMLG
jgi:hypothetical protein